MARHLVTLKWYDAMATTRPDTEPEGVAVESRLHACIGRNRAPRSVFENNAALHHKCDAPNGRDVFQRISTERNHVGLQAGAIEPI